MTKLAIRAGLVLCAAAVLVPGGAAAPPPACAAGAGTHVAFVVDFGGAPGSPGGVEVTCVAVSPGSTGAGALQARATQLGTPSPRYASSGLLCAIDGFPAGGCGERDSSGYHYWSYWHRGTNGWTYASTGPASWPAGTGDVEGWRYENPGTGTAADPPPASSATFDQICPPPPSPTSTSTLPPTTAAAVTAAAVTAPPLRTTAPPPRVTRPEPTTTSTTSTIPATTQPDVTTTSPPGVALSPKVAQHPRSSSAAPVAAALLLIAGLAGAAAWRWRR